MLVMKPDDDVIKVQTYNMRLEKEGEVATAEVVPTGMLVGTCVAEPCQPKAQTLH